MKGKEKLTFHAYINPKNSGVATLIIHKVNFKASNITEKRKII